MFKCSLIFILLVLSCNSLWLLKDSETKYLQTYQSVINCSPEEALADEIKKWSDEILSQKESNTAKIELLKDLRNNLITMNDSLKIQSEYIKSIERSLEASDDLFKSLGYALKNEYFTSTDLAIEYLNWANYKKLIIPQLKDYYISDSLYAELLNKNLKLIDEKIGMLEDCNKKIIAMEDYVCDEYQTVLDRCENY
jgi:hypothetical protein